MRKEYHYSQSVKIPSGGETVFIAGQGGWDPAADTMEIATGPDAERIQIEQALKNVELALNEAGAEMKHVFKVRSRSSGVPGSDRPRLIVDALAFAVDPWCSTRRTTTRSPSTLASCLWLRSGGRGLTISRCGRSSASPRSRTRGCSSRLTSSPTSRRRRRISLPWREHSALGRNEMADF